MERSKRRLQIIPKYPIYSEIYSKIFQNIPKYSKFQIFQNIPKYSKMFQNIPKYSKIFQFFPKYSKKFQNIPKNSKIYQNIPKYSKLTQLSFGAQIASFCNFLAIFAPAICIVCSHVQYSTFYWRPNC